MATLNIKDPEVYRLARELATRRRTTATGAVRDALREALERDRQDRQGRAGMAERILVVGRRSAARPEAFATDDELYDERGLPR